jgi:plasmid stabilization system protein ParE
MRPLIVRAEAEADIEVAFRWYEEQSPGLGAEFLRAVDASLSGIEREPERNAAIYKQSRRVLLRRFPFAVHYVIQPKSIDVVACMHMRRHPRRWQRRV